MEKIIHTMRELELILTNPDLNKYVLKNYFFRFKPKALLTYLCNQTHKISMIEETEELVSEPIKKKIPYKDIIIYEKSACEVRGRLLDAIATYYTRQKYLGMIMKRKNISRDKVYELNKLIDEINYDVIPKVIHRPEPLSPEKEKDVNEKKKYNDALIKYNKFIDKFKDSKLLNEIYTELKNKSKLFLSKQELAWLSVSNQFLKEAKK